MENFYNKALEYVGVPFLSHGRSKFGIDCVGLIYCVASDCNYLIDDFAEYDIATPITNCTELLIDRGFQESSAPDTGNVVLLEFPRGRDGKLQHLGIFGYDEEECPSMIHCYTSAGSVLVSSWNYWKKYHKKTYAIAA